MADQEVIKAATGQDAESKTPEITPGTKAGTPIGVPAVSVPASAKPEGDLGNDIAKILADVKLPERHDATSEKKQIENKAVTYDTALGTEQIAPQTIEEKQAPSAAASQEAPGTPSSVHSVHTLKDDLQHVVRDQKISVVRAVSLEEDRRSRDRSKVFDAAPEAPKRKRGLGILFSVLLLLVLGGGALVAVYIVMQGHAASPPAASSSILFAESAVALPIDNRAPDDLKRTLASARTSSQAALGSITEIIPTVTTTAADGSTQTRPATFGEFMNAIGAHPPDELIRALSSNFFFGIHTVDKQAPLFVVPVVSYDHAFAGMLAWEGTLNPDLAPIFTVVPALSKDANGLPVQRTFQDLVMRNYDTRALEDDSGQVELYYSFPTQNVLVIAESPYSFTEILSRLQAARQL
jgi:hypothetical protein